MPHRLTTIRTFRLSPLGCVGLLLLLAGCGRDRTQSAPDTAIGEATKSASKGDWPADDRRSHVFVGSQACAECHADLVQRYQSHPMARSMTTPDRLPDHVMAAIPGQVEFGGRSYGVTQDGGEQFQTEKLEDAEGEIYSQQCRVDLAFGSGTHGYTFASIQGNALYQVPLTWYEDIKGWDLSPGYHRPDHDRFERRISDDCVSCHMGRVAPEGHNTNRFGKNFIVEASIGCERCHGPGAEHIDYHSAGVASAAHPDPIVNPARLPVHARESVCFQCHLSGESKVLRAGRSAYDFRPGDRISDIWVTLVNQPATGESVTNSQAVSHVEQMVSSKCYQESAGAFQCTSCHDPHGVPSEEQRIPFHNGRCQSCHHEATSECSLDHQQRQSTAPPNSCVSCHLPQKGASDIPHTARTDHRILRFYDDSAEENTETRLGVFQPDRQNVPEKEIQRAFGLTLAIRARTAPEVEAAYGLLLPLVDDDPEDAELFRAIATLRMQLGDPSAGRLLAKAVALRPEDEAILQTQLSLQWINKDYFGSLRTTNTLLRLNPWNSLNLRTRAQLLAHLGRLDDSVAAARRSIEVNPMNLSTRQILEHVLKETGNDVEAARQTKLIERLNLIGRKP